MWPGHLPTPLVPLDDAHARAARDGSVRFLYSGPVRHGKSTLNAAAIVRYLACRPGEWVMLAGHSQDFAETKSREIRDKAEQAGHLVRGDASKLSRWQLTTGGGVIASGIGAGGLMGSGASLFVADDLFATREQAESAAERERAFQWVTGTALTRLTPKGSAIFTGARWHLDDVHGRLEAAGGWEVANQCALDEHGSALWPEGGWTADILEAKRREIGAYDFASQYQGTPIVRGESLFAEPLTYSTAELADALADDARIVLALDPAAGVSNRNDYSAAAVMALHGGGPDTRGFLLHMWRDRLALPELVRRVVALARQWGASAVLVEGVAGFRGYADAIRAIAGRSLRVHVPTLRGDKWVRSQPLANAIASGAVRVPDTRAAWLRPFLDELLSFPAAAHDDQVDACAMAFNAAALGPRRVRSRRELAAVRARLNQHLPFGA
jgi:predicted phage terminase large subunit-like protein